MPLFYCSHSDGKENSMSDIDIGIYFKGKVDSKQVGFDTAMLEKQFSKKIDITILNGIEKKDPLFGFNVLSWHRLIVLNDDILFLASFHLQTDICSQGRGYLFKSKSAANSAEPVLV